MSQKKKMVIFASSAGIVLLALVIVLVMLLGQGQPVSNPSGNSTTTTPSTVGTQATQGGDTTDAGTQNNDGSTTANNDTTTSQTVGSSQTNAAQSTNAHNHTTTTTTTITTTTATKATAVKPEGEKTFSVLQDPTFQNGFKALGLNSADGGANGRVIFNPLNSNGRQYWNLAAWGSRYAFGDSQYTTFKDLGNGVFKYVNPTKEFTIDTKNTVLTFTGITSKCYDTHRTGSEPWLHLLIEQSFRSADTKVTELESVQLTLANRLTMFKDNMGDAFNPNAHAAQFLMYLSVKNNDPTSPDYNKYIWFGIPFFDNRSEWMEKSSMFDRGTQSLMVGIGTRVLYEKNGKNNCWKNGKINAGPNVEWSEFSIDLLPLIYEAIDTAHRDGYLLNTNMEQLVIAGMNLGWEIPGSYDATMEIKNFSLIATKK